MADESMLCCAVVSNACAHSVEMYLDVAWCVLQETDRGRHDKRALNKGFYSVPFDPLKTMPC